MTASNVHPFNTPHRVFQDALNLIRAGAHETMRRERPGMSDQDRDAEFEAQNIFFSSLSHFRADCERAIAMSPLRGAQIKELLDAVSYYSPGRVSWDEDISNARRGY